MTPRKLHKDLPCIVEEWLQQAQSPTICDSIRQHASHLSTLLDQSAELQEKRSFTNAQIGKQRNAGHDVGELIDRVKALSGQIKDLESQIDDTDTKLLALQPMSDSADSDTFTNALDPQTDALIPDKPGQFLAQRFADFKVQTSASHEKSAVEIIECKDGVVWDAYAALHHGSTHYHQYAWRALIDRNFGHTSFYLEARYSNGTLSGLLPIVHMKSVFFGSFLLSMPWLIYGGAVASDRASHQALGNHVKQLMRDRNCSRVDMREVHAREGWMGIPGKVAMVLTLPDNQSRFNTSLGSKLRAQVKRADRLRPTIRFGGRELVPEFYKVFSEKMRDLGTPVYHRRFFEDIACTFPESAVFVVVMVDGQPAAASCLLSYRDTLEVPWAAARKRYNKDGINMYMYHSILEEAIVRGYRFFDFGRSTVGESTYRFKKQWGAEPYALNWQRYPPSNPAESAGDTGIVMRTASSFWKHMPVAATRILGPKIAGNLPW